MENKVIPINLLIDRINEAAESGIGMSLSIEEVKLLSGEIGDSFFVPFYSNEEFEEKFKIKK